MAANSHRENGNHHKKSEVAVVMVPLPAQGHLNQLLHLSHRLISAASLPVFYVGGATHVRQAKLRAHGWDPSAFAKMNFHEFPTPSFGNPEPNPHAPTKFPSQLLPSFSATVFLRDPFFTFAQNLSKNYKRLVVIYDSLMAYVVQDLDSVSNAECYCFWSVSAFATYYFAWHINGKPDLPGQAGSILREMPGPDGLFSPELQDFVRLQIGSTKKISGAIQNSNRVIEDLYLDLLAEAKKDVAERHFAVGPFNPVVISYPGKRDCSLIRHECLDWLDKHGSTNSVIFVSFGTTTSVSDEQIQELAIGLENSGQKFIWVFRDADKGDIFTGEARKPVLPDGFEERVKGRGLVVRDWAPQLDILGHLATGGFMSHCGWNSCMESMSQGVPIAAWPMHSDQPANAVLVTKVLKIGLEVENWACVGETVQSGVVERAVRKLMASEEGDEMRRRAEELGVAVRDSVKEGGISKQEMESFISHVTR